MSEKKMWKGKTGCYMVWGWVWRHQVPAGWPTGSTGILTFPKTLWVDLQRTLNGNLSTPSKTMLHPVFQLCYSFSHSLVFFSRWHFNYSSLPNILDPFKDYHLLTCSQPQFHFSYPCICSLVFPHCKFLYPTMDRFLWNVATYLPSYTASYPRKPKSLFFSLFALQMSVSWQSKWV
jgi:hypothetical protein